jgi:hypothetical protein
VWEDVDLLLRAVVRIIPSSVEGNRDRFQADDFILENNYPNPFNHATVISFVLEKPALVALTIMDTRGRRVRSLAGGSFARSSQGELGRL